MGVRQAVWREELYKEKDFFIKSAGVADYLSRVPSSEFCLHAEGNGWSSRVNDYVIMGCVPVFVNTGIVYSFEDIIPYDKLSIKVQKRDLKELPTLLRIERLRLPAMLATMRRYRRAFAWYGADGLAYEYTLASLGKKILRLF